MAASSGANTVNLNEALAKVGIKPALVTAAFNSEKLASSNNVAKVGNVEAVAAVLGTASKSSLLQAFKLSAIMESAIAVFCILLNIFIVIFYFVNNRILINVVTKTYII